MARHCIVCDKIEENELFIEKHDVLFCSDDCLNQYELKLEDLKNIMDWDKCC